MRFSSRHSDFTSRMRRQEFYFCIVRRMIREGSDVTLVTFFLGDVVQREECLNAGIAIPEHEWFTEAEVLYLYHNNVFVW